MASDSNTKREVKLYDRQQGEPESAYLAFIAYRDGARPRTKVFSGPGWTVAQAREWRESWCWEIRVQEWDSELALIERNALRESIEETAAEKGRSWGQVLKRSRAMVERELAKLDAISSTNEYPLPGVSMAQLTRLLEVTLKCERLIDELPTEIIESKYDFDRLPLEKRKLLRTLLQEASVENEKETNSVTN